MYITDTHKNIHEIMNIIKNIETLNLTDWIENTPKRSSYLFWNDDNFQKLKKNTNDSGLSFSINFKSVHAMYNPF